MPASEAPAPAPCRTDVLAGWHAHGLAVLWVPPADAGGVETAALPAAVAAVDVRDGTIRSYCALPAPAADPVVQAPYATPMRQGREDYPPFETDVDLMLATQWFSPDFRWFGAPGLPLVDVAHHRVVDAGWDGGTLVGVGRDLALVRTGDRADTDWCTVALPPRPGQRCTPVRHPAGPGSVVLGADGSPVWVPAAAVPLRFGGVSGYAVTDGRRVYRADTEPAARRLAAPSGTLGAPVDVAPSGTGGFPVPGGGAPGGDASAWFTVTGVDRTGVHARLHRTTAPPASYRWMLGSVGDVSRAVADGGRVAVTARLREEDGVDPLRRTHFGALVDGTGLVVDLTEQRGLRCPVDGADCRILDWPDGSLGVAVTGSS